MENNEFIEIMRLSPEATLPTRAHADDAGLDLYNLEDVLLEPGQGKAVKTGIALAIPLMHVGIIADRSSLAKRGLKSAGGIVDSGYRGEVHIILWNISNDAIQIKRGERIAQLMIVPIRTPKVKEVTRLNETARGSKGFGSSGK